MNTDRELMQQALEALEVATTPLAKDRQEVLRAQAALRERLAQPEQEPFCFHDGRNIVGKEYADHSDVFPLYTSPNPEQQKPVRFNCTVIDDAHLNGVPLSQWGKQHEMQPCAGRNCGSTNPNLHSAECFEDYEKATGMAQQEQKPVAWGVFDGPNLHDVNFTEEEAHEMAWLKGDGSVVNPLYTSPPAQRKPLTDEQIEEIAARTLFPVKFARAIEAAHGIGEKPDAA